MKKRMLIFLTTIMFLLVISASIVGIAYANQVGKQFTIYIDPGHGGFDGGATSTDKGTIEKTITLAISLQLATYLEKTGFRVYLTRSTDIALGKNKKEDIYERVDVINRSPAQLYVSIHANSFSSAAVHGAQTFYHPAKLENKQLADSIMTMLKKIDPVNTRVAKTLTDKYLIDHVTIPGCLVEVGFLSNPADLTKLLDKEYQASIALMIYSGILEYIEITGVS